MRLTILLFTLLNLTFQLYAQKKKVLIVADISGFPGKVPISNNPEWQGSDTLVPMYIQGKGSSSHIMGAEYIYTTREGDSLSPNDDALPTNQRQLWRCKATIEGNKYIWAFEINKPVEITNISLWGGEYLVFPGDTLYIKYDRENIYFSGNARHRFTTAYQINKAVNNIPFTDKHGYPLDIERYLTRSNYLNQQLTIVDSMLRSNQSNLNEVEYNWIKGTQTGKTEYHRWLYFVMIAQPKEIPNLPYSDEDLMHVWDTTMYHPMAVWFRKPDIQNSPGVDFISYTYNFIQREIRRHFKLQITDSISNEASFKKMIYRKIKEDYKGIFRERLLCNFISEEIIQEMVTYNWFAHSILKDYYQTPGFPAYKNWMREWDKTITARNPPVDILWRTAPLFNLVDRNGLPYTKDSITGKFAIFNFWYTGCDPCQQTARQLDKMQAKYNNDTNVIVINVSTDSDTKQWQKSIKEGIFVPRKGVHLFTGGLGKKHEILKDFDIVNYPTLRFIEPDHHIVLDKNRPYATTFTDQELMNIIGQQLNRFKDGPYIFKKNNQLTAYSIDGTSVKSDSLGKKTLRSQTDNYGESFPITLKKVIISPPSQYEMPSKMLVLSDIEGNFTSFRKLLQANNVINKEYNWAFGNGHLVLAGDMFDRGEQVTECLWLLYTLEEQAKAAGGYVHFVLGNHEIMNLSGNDKYVAKKYKDNYVLLGKSLADIYGENSELGQWLRTKNIVEKIGSILICHGGISPQVNNMPLGIEEINKKAKAYYAQSAAALESPDKDIRILFHGYQSPFWYRHYYIKNHLSKSNNELVRHASQAQIDSTCRKFDISHIITGHTIVADNITTHYDNKVINTDTRHATGKSEALLVEQGNYFRVSDTGIKILLFKKNDDNVTVASKMKIN